MESEEPQETPQVEYDRSVPTVDVSASDSTAKNGPTVEQGPPATVTPPTKKCSKCSRARYPLLVILACLSYLWMCGFVVNTGLYTQVVVLSQVVNKTALQLNAASDQYYAERLLYGRLESLLTSPLQKGYLESHNECLARGIDTAYAHYYWLAFEQYPDIRNQTVEWVEEHCDRAHFTLLAQQTDSSMLRLNYWSRLNYRVEKILQGMKRRAFTLKSWLVKKVTTEKPAESGHGNVGTSKKYLDDIPIVLPSRFKMACGTGACRIVYYEDPSFNKSTIEKDLLVALQRKIDTMVAITDKAISTIYLLDAVQRAFLISQCLLIILHMMIDWYDPVPSRPMQKEASGWLKNMLDDVGPEEKYVVQSLALQAVALGARLTILNTNLSLYDTHSLQNMVFICGVTAASMAIMFAVPNGQVEDIFMLYKALKDLFAITRDSIWRKRHDQDVNAKEALEWLGLNPQEASIPASDFPRRRIPSVTSLNEDLDEERQIMRKGLSTMVQDDSMDTQTKLEDVDLGLEESSGPESDWSLVNDV